MASTSSAVGFVQGHTCCPARVARCFRGRTCPYRLRDACWFGHDDDLEEVRRLAALFPRLLRTGVRVGCACATDHEGDVDGFHHRVGEQIGAVPVPQIWEPVGEVVQLSPQERVQNCTPEQIMDSSVPQLLEAVVEVTPQERVLNRTQEQIVGVPVPQIMEDGLPVVPQERVQNRTLEQIVGVPVPQITEDGLPVVPQERLQHRTPEQIVGFPVPQIVHVSVQNRTLEQVSVSTVPQIMEAVVEVFPPSPQERVQNRPRKLFVDVPVPHIMEQTTGKVKCTGKVFTVLHHCDDQARTVDTLGFNIKGLDKYTMPRSGDVMVPALHMEEPVPQIAEDIVERPLPSVHEAVRRFFEQHALEDELVSWDSLEASLPPGFFGDSPAKAFEEEEEEEENEEEEEILASS